MKMSHRLVGAFALCAVAVTIFLVSAGRGLAADPVAPKNAAKWEYATIYDGRQNTAFESKELLVNLREPGAAQINVKSWEELGTKLGVADAHEEEDAVLNALGKRGWELIFIRVNDRSGLAGTYYYFKRPAQ